VTILAQQIFPTPLSFSTLDQGDPFRIYGKALRMMKLVFQAANGEELVILACTTFDWSTHVMDRQTDRRTELRWLGRAIAVPAVAHKNVPLGVDDLNFASPS